MTTLSINDFTTETTSHAPGRIMPQKAGNALWRPMFVMALMAFAVGFVLAIVRANMISNGDDPLQIAAFGQYIPAAMFVGFASIFAAISFAIAKILGEFRVGGGSVQEAVGGDVKTLKMPGTAKAFIALMAMAMMVILAAVVLHVVAGVSIAAGDWSAVKAEQWTIWLEAARRFGVVLYLFSITFGLVTIAKVIRFQTFRLRQVAHTE
ncbi:MAG: hypothetical protein DRJ28_10070 [Actinobacteria bacterium]|nr:MAG: hypothetical protein DRJ28_10070 [Actinomycetota bacterium]